MRRKRAVIITLVLVVLSGFVFREKLIQTYVVVAEEHLEKYAERLLDCEERKSDRYGLWKTRCYSEENMVEFMTGGFGLAPSSTYKGFYYSADNTHRVFSVADESLAILEVNGDHAAWTDGTDNNGTSTRITENWFWFEASF